MRYWEMNINSYYMHNMHIFSYDGENYWRRPYDIWSKKYLPKWEKLDILELEPLEFDLVKLGSKKFLLLP